MACDVKKTDTDSGSVQSSTQSPIESETTETEPVSSKSKDDISSQIQLIVDNFELWKMDGEFVQDSKPYGGYTVTDIDKNARLEIISSEIEGSGNYSYNNIWEVNESFDALVLCKREQTAEKETQIDIMEESVPAYYDDDLCAYYLTFDDMKGDSLTYLYEEKRALSLQNGLLIEKILAHKTIIEYKLESDRDDSSSYSDPTYRDMDGKNISEEEYNNITDRYYGELQKMQAYIQWIDAQDMSGIENDELYNILYCSYHEFSIQ